MDDVQHTIALNMKKIRLQKGLSLDQTAALTGVSKSMLSQIEKEKSNPTIGTLWKIATGLQVSFSSFIKREEREIKKVESDHLTPVIDDQNKYLVYSLFPFHPGKKFEIYLVKLKAHSVHHSEQHAGEEYLLISTGKISLTIHEQTYLLKNGDALNFTSNGTHIYKNDSDQDAVLFDIIYYQD